MSKEELIEKLKNQEELFKMDKLIIGIDPGMKGGIAVISKEGKYFTVPYTGYSLHYILLHSTNQGLDSHKVSIYLEKVHSMPRQGVASTFAFGRTYGKILGIISCMFDEEKINYVPPQEWKKEFGLINKEWDKKEKKQASIDKCKELFPGINLFATKRSKVDHDGMAEALLIAEYGRRKECHS